MPIQFYDETGVNTLKPGLFVSIYNGFNPPIYAQPVAQAWTLQDGSVEIGVINQSYTVSIVGPRQAIPNVQFTGSLTGPTTLAGVNTTVVTVAGYRTPLLSQTGYTIEKLKEFPIGPGWPGDAARMSGGNLWDVFVAGSWANAFTDSETLGLLASERVWSCLGENLDSWARDFLGFWLPRYYLESDDSYRARVVAILSNPPATLSSMYNVVLAFYTAIQYETGITRTQNLTSDGLGAPDASGATDYAPGFSPYIPQILVWDRQSNPHLANKYNVNPNNDNGTFVIQIGSQLPANTAWFLDRSFLDYSSFLIAINDYILSDTPPDPRLGDLVNFIKAIGTKPLYLTALLD